MRRALRRCVSQWALPDPVQGGTPSVSQAQDSLSTETALGQQRKETERENMGDNFTSQGGENECNASSLSTQT